MYQGHLWNITLVKNDVLLDSHFISFYSLFFFQHRHVQQSHKWWYWGMAFENKRGSSHVDKVPGRHTFEPDHQISNVNLSFCCNRYYCLNYLVQIIAFIYSLRAYIVLLQGIKLLGCGFDFAFERYLDGYFYMFIKRRLISSFKRNFGFSW